MDEAGTIADPGSDEEAQAELDFIEAMKTAARTLGDDRVAEMAANFEKGQYR